MSACSAAGLVGLVHAQAALAQAALLPVLHLGDINPYVTGAMEMGSKQGGGWAVPRQPSSLVAGSVMASEAHAIGVSAFAFQGTNAHALMASTVPPGSSISKPTAGWQHQRFWVAPQVHVGKLRLTAPARLQSIEL